MTLQQRSNTQEHIMRNGTATLEKDIQVGDLVNRVIIDEVFYNFSYFGRCIANNGKTLKFEVLIPSKELQLKYGRPTHNGDWTPYGNWRVEIPYAGNEEHFTVSKEIVKCRISKFGYHKDVVTPAQAVYYRMGRDPNWD